MSINTIRSLAIASIGLVAFVVILVIAKIYTDSEVPIQFAGALLGAIVTAVITMTLLHGQSQAEEAKERNVKVFEEKTRRYNEFLEALWKVWEDRRITLEELSGLMEMFSRDIVIYTKEASSQKIVRSLTKIANHAGNQRPGEREQLEVQAEVFEIINVIAAELNLGGCINDSMRADLNALEGRIRPFLEAKELKAEMLREVDAVFATDDSDLSFSPAYYDQWDGNTYLCVRVDNSKVELIAGPVENHTGTEGYLLGLFVEFYGGRSYQAYRDAARGFKKDFLRGIQWGFEIVCFNREESVASWKEKLVDPDSENPARLVARQMLDFAKSWHFEGKSLLDVLNACEPSRQSRPGK